TPWSSKSIWRSVLKHRHQRQFPRFGTTFIHRSHAWRKFFGCANEPFARGYPAGTGSGGARGGSRLTDLAQPQVFNYAEKCQQLNFLRFSGGSVGQLSVGWSRG